MLKIKSPLKPKAQVLASKKETDYQKIFANRIQIFLIGIIISFLMVLLALFRIQILENENYQIKLENFTQVSQNMAAPRGKMFDRYGEILVSNTERLAIVYYPPANMTSTKEWELAYKMADTFEFDYSILTSRDLKDLYLRLYPSEGKTLIKDEEWNSYYDGQLSDNDIYLLKLSRITDSDLSKLDDRTREAYVVEYAMSESPYQSLKVIKDNASIDEVAYLIEHNSLFPGFDVNLYFDRSYPQGTLLRGLLGSVTSSTQGLASENLLTYLALGYARNSSVGRSGLEIQYESLLKGTDSSYQVNYNSDGLAYFTENIVGSKGQDLVLSIDADLQRKVEELLSNALANNIDNPYRAYLRSIYLVAMDPNTGDVLSIAGMKRTDDGETIYNDPVSAYTDSYAAGSSIKGAVVYMGLSEDLITANESILDAPIKIADTPMKRSWKDLGYVTDQTALAMSSNVYMFNIAMRLGGASYVYNGPLNIDIEAFNTFRSYFSQFGLGVYTGLDVNNESLGYRGFSSLGGHLLDFAIGQYDTYTTIQLAQYISTIANDGLRVKPRLLLESHVSDTQITSYVNPVTVLNQLDDLESLKRVQSGFRLCVTDGLCASLGNLNVTVAAKTGTAENYIYPGDGTSFDSPNSTLVSYAPYESPKIAIACAAPHAWNTKSQANICLGITNEIYAYYFSKG